MQTNACTDERGRSRGERGADERGPDERVTLSQAARLAPGRPSPNCVWRWCRRGVLARTGERVRLEHVRLGGRLYTTPRWLEAFGRRLAEADAAYFDATNGDAGRERVTAPASSAPASAPGPAPRRRRRPTDREEADRRARVAAELDAEGL